MSKTLNKRLIDAEGFEHKLYRDTSDRTGFEGRKGKISIGIGYNIDDLGLPDDIIIELFNRKLKEAEDQLATRAPWTSMLDEPRREVLVEMVYNMGIDGVMKFQATLSALQRGKYDEAAGHLRDSLVYRQLPKRYEVLAKILETGNA